MFTTPHAPSSVPPVPAPRPSPRPRGAKRVGVGCPALPALLALALPLGLASSVRAADAPATHPGLLDHEVPSDPIVNGELESGYLGVVSLGADLGNPFSACSGALITPRVVLTAAHCGADLPTALIVAIGQAFLGPDLDHIEQRYGFTDYLGHEDYVPLGDQPGDRPANDVGVGILDDDADATPFFFNTRELTRDDEDTELLSVGYGITGPNEDDGGIKRSAVVTLTGLDDDFIISANSTNPNDANICSGDSGGPMFRVEEDGRPVIWAVHSWGDGGCVQLSGSTRTDLMADWILDRVEDEHGSRDLCEINGYYENGVCDAFCEDDAVDCLFVPVVTEVIVVGAGQACSGCSSGAASGGSPGTLPPALAWLLLGLPALRRRGRTGTRSSARPAAPTFLAALAMLLPFAAPAHAAKPALPTLSTDDLADARAGKIVLTKTTNEAGESLVNAVVELAAGPDALWPIIFSTAHVKKSSSSVKVCDSTRDVTQPDGQRFMDLDYVLKIGFSEIRYSVNRHYTPADGTMRWTLDKSRPADITWTEGSYSTYPGSAPGRTMFLYRARIVTGKAIPAWLEEDLTESSLKRYLKYLQDTAETK